MNAFDSVFFPPRKRGSRIAEKPVYVAVLFGLFTRMIGQKTLRLAVAIAAEGDFGETPLRDVADMGIVDRRNRSGVPAALVAKVKTISAQNQIWAVSLGGFSQIASAVPPAGPMASLGKILSMLEDLTLAVDLGSGVNAAVTGLCKTEQDARSLSDALRGLIGLGRLSTPSNEPEMLRLYDGIQVEQQQRTVRLRAQIPQDLLDKAIGKVAALSEASPPPRRR